MKENDKKVTVVKGPDLSNTANVAMDKSKADSIIYSQGYRLFIDRAVQCPCKSKNSSSWLSTCKNCGSTGWVFINRKQVKGIVYSMNWDHSYKEWSEEDLGNAFFTLRNEDKVSFMDRITVIDAETIHKQILYPFSYKGKYAAYTTYSIKDIVDVFLFVGDDQKLLLLENGVDYNIGSGFSVDECNDLNDNIIEFSSDIANMFRSGMGGDFTVSVTYKHPPQYHIIHLVRDSMVSVQIDKSSKRMPISAAGRRSHFVLDSENYAGNRLFDNSYL